MKGDQDPGWLTSEAELIKTIHGYEFKGSNEEVGSIDYVSREKGEGVKLLRVILDPESGKSEATQEKIQKTIDYLENEEYSDTLIVAEEFTQGAIRKVKETEHLDYLSPRLWKPHSIFEIVHAIQKKTEELCESICGKVPTTEGECKGYSKDGPIRRYNCQVRRISDDSDFHAEMGWTPLLISDFNSLLKIQREIDDHTREEHM
ncbi:MAG: hypothetical protein OEZ44_09950 [Candidatus Bathyarchaeota archaeon]|nr:hypothetical protein [Candidatus Bathyarchaeota archaeon]